MHAQDQPSKLSKPYGQAPKERGQHVFGLMTTLTSTVQDNCPLSVQKTQMPSIEAMWQHPEGPLQGYDGKQTGFLRL